MTDQSDATQADADAQSQADTQNEDTTQADVQESISLDEAKKLRAESAALRKRLKEAESKVQAATDAGKSDEEKRAAAMSAAEDRAAKAETRLREVTGRAATVEEAVKANAISPKAVFAMIRDQIDYDDDGEPKNIAALIEKARKDEPALFRQGGADGGKGNPNGGQDLNAMLRAQLGRG